MKVSNSKYKYILIIFIILTLLITLVTVPISANDVGPAHDLDRDDDSDDVLEVDVEPATDENGDVLTSDAAMTFNVSIVTQNARNTYPYIYPIDLDILESDEIINTQTIFLTPTQSENYVPSYGNEDETQDYELKEEFQIYLTFNDQFEDDLSTDGNLTRRLSFEFESRFTDDDNTIPDNYDIEGSTPQGRSSSSATISITSGFDEPSEVTHVDRYRINEQETNQGFLEDFSIPYDSDYTGEIRSFQNMRQPNSDGGAIISSSDNGFNAMTQTRNVPREEPQTIAITYNIFDGNDITVNPVRANLNSIDPDTEYILPTNPEDSEYCQIVSSSNAVCLFSLSSTEISEINNLGELYLEYDTHGEDVSAEIFCQGIISGYFSTDDATCGTSGLVSSDLIEISSFVGKQLTDDDIFDYHSDNVPLEFNRQTDGQTERADVNMQASVKTNLDDDENIELEYGLANQDDVNRDGTIDSFLDIQTIELSEGEEFILDMDYEIFKEDVLDTYVIILCEVGDVGTDDCTNINNIDYDRLSFSSAGPGNAPELNIKSPISLNLDELNRDTIIQERVQTQTTDENFGDNSEWYKIDDETIDGFTGEIDESVTVERARSSDPRNSAGEAIDELSNISPEGEWITGDYDSFVSVNERVVRYVPEGEDFSGGGWERVSSTPERTAQIGTTEQLFAIVSGAEFQSITESERGWYLDRSGESSTRENNQVETLWRHTDPDDCYNCLRAEKHDPNSAEMTEAEERFESSSQEIISSPEGEDNWERISDEPIIATMEEKGIQYEYRSADLDEGFSKIFDWEESDEALWRQGDFDEREIYQWERTSENNELPFKAPIRDEITEWQLEVYDIEYVFTGNINSPSDLYTYQKDIDEQLITWDPDDAWFDFSNSERGDNGAALNQLEFSYVGTSQTYNMDWINHIHSQTPEEIEDDISNICDGEATINRVDGGTGGVGLIETCDIDGEEQVTRIGKEYNQEGTYNPELTLIDSNGARTTENVIVRVNEGDGTPDFEVEEINERVDYQVGQIAIDGTLTSELSKLNDIYTLEVSPADSFSGTDGCPTSYTQDESFDIQMQTTTTDLFRQTDDCIHNAFEEPDDVPDEFVRYYELADGDTTTEDIPSGAIQNCYGPALSNTGDDNECGVSESYQGDNGEDMLTFKTTMNNVDNYESIDGDTLSHDYCPSGYSLEQTEHEDEDVSQFNCELTTDVEFSLSSRQISVDYSNIQSGVVEQCSDIVTSSETGSHSGYMNTGSDGDEHCELVDPADPGPSDFTLYDSEEEEFNSPPSGAIRGQRLTDEENSIGNCESFNTEDGILSCEYDDGSSSTTIEYASITEGNWNFVPQNLDRVDVSLDNTQKIVWESDFIKAGDVDTTVSNIENPEEDFTITMNPRQIPMDSSKIGDGNTVEFEFELKSSSGTTVSSDSVEIQFCQANGISENNFPRTIQGPNECDGFDTLLSGTDDFRSDRKTLDDAREQFEEDNSNTEHTITSVKNDICPYSLEYPYGQENIEGYDISVDENTNWRELENELEEQIRHRYSANNPCLEEGLGITTPTSNEQTFTFNSESFRQPDSVQNVRRIGITDLETMHGNGISQSRWDARAMGGSLRLGTPIMPNNAQNDMNEHLVSAYTFDHDGINGQAQDKFGNIVNPPIHGKVTDVYSSLLYSVDAEIADLEWDDNDEYIQHIQDIDESPTDLHHARLAYGTPCNNELTSKIEHEFLEDGQGINCEFNSMSRSTAQYYFEDDEFRNDYGSIVPNIDSQSAILSKPPLREYRTEIQQGGVVDDGQNYDSSGLFGGNALKLDETSWLMITPPCINRDYVGLELNRDNFDNDDFDPYDCTYEGGMSNLYEDENRPDRLNTKLRNSNYTISFWVKEDGEMQTSHPLRTIFSISASSSRNDENIVTRITDNAGVLNHQSNEPPYAHTTMELQSMDIPQYEDDSQVTYPYTMYNIGNSEDGLAAVYPLHEFVSAQTFRDGSDYTGDYGWDRTTGDDDYYVPQALEYNANEEWNHVVLSSTFDTDDDGPRTFDVYVDGRYQGSADREHKYREDDRRYYQTGGVNDFSIDSGHVYIDSVISIGGRYLDAGHNQNGIYAPQIEATEGDIYIDDLRIYEENVETLNDIPQFDGEPVNRLFENSAIGQTYHGVTNKEGTIRSDVQSMDSLRKDIDEINPLSSLNLNIDYDGEGDFEIGIIPCEGGDCYSNSAGSITKDELGDNDIASTSFKPHESPNTDLSNIDGFQLEVTLSTEDITESPQINEIELTVDSTPYQTCQEIALNHPSFIGNDIHTELVEIQNEDVEPELSHYETACDMNIDGGGWTQFYWAEEGGTYQSDIEREDRYISNCEEDSGACFSPAKFDAIDNINADMFPEHMEIDNLEEDMENNDVNAQILIKSITDERTENWTAFELVNIETGEHNEYTEFMETYFTEGIPIDDGRNAALDETCVYAFASSQDYNSNECIDSVNSINDNTRFLSSPDGDGAPYDYLNIEREDGRVTSVTCLDSDADRCEVYYRIGSSGEYPEYLDFLRSPTTDNSQYIGGDE